MTTKTIQLSAAIKGHDGPVTQVVLREPNYRDFAALGDPFVIARNPDGTLFNVENAEVIQKYIERCMESPDFLLIGQASLSDAMAIKDALLDFFVAAREKTLPTPPASSSTN